MLFKMIFRIYERASCSSFYVEEFYVIVHKQVFSLKNRFKFLAILYQKSIANLTV